MGKQKQCKNTDEAKNKHVIEFASARVVIEDGAVVEVGEPQLKYCPLYDRLYGIKVITKDVVKWMIEKNIADHGTYTERRVLEHEDLVLFGASEMIMNALKKGLLDAAVIACDGAGTVVTNDSDLVQGIGARLTGIISTTPIPKVIEKLKAKGARVLYPENAAVNQVEGLAQAVKSGFRKIAVTIAGKYAQETVELRKIEKEKDVKVIIFAVHNTGISMENAETLVEQTDLVWGCASKAVREVIGPKAMLQEGTAIPVFALTENGKSILLARAETLKEPLLITKAKLPTLSDDKSPKPLK